MENTTRRRLHPGLRPQHDHRPDHGSSAGQPAQRRHRAVRPASRAPGGTRRTAPLDCAKLAPAPVSDARIVLNVDRLRFTDTPAPWGSRTAPGSSSWWPTIRAARRSRSTSSAATSPGRGGRHLHLLLPGTAGEGCDRSRLRQSGSRRHRSRSRRVPARRLHEHRTEPDLRQFQQQQDPHAAGRDRAAGSGRDDGAGQLLRRHRPGRRQGGRVWRVPRHDLARADSGTNCRRSA